MTSWAHQEFSFQSTIQLDVNNLEWLHVLKKRVVLPIEVRVCQLDSFLDSQLHLLPSGKDCSHFPMGLTNRYHGAHLCMTVMLNMQPLLASTLLSSMSWVDKL